MIINAFKIGSLLEQFVDMHNLPLSRQLTSGLFLLQVANRILNPFLQASRRFTRIRLTLLQQVLKALDVLLA
jgi:hypothetical protein